MAELDDIAYSLAKEVIATMEETGDDRLFDQASKMVADTSSTLHEAFITAVRVLRADRRARELLGQVTKAHHGKKAGEAKAPAAPAAAPAAAAASAPAAGTHPTRPAHPTRHGGAHGHAAAGHAHAAPHAGANPPQGGSSR